jgi:hypothetical protein
MICRWSYSSDGPSDSYQRVRNFRLTAHSINPSLLMCKTANLRELGYIFAEGNVSETFRSFEIDHMCNRFCRTFGLPSAYEDWDAVA